MNRRKMVVLGKSVDDEGNVVWGGIPLEDLKTHALVVGTTGSGKSTLLRNLAAQTYALGATTCIIEPHGDLCLDVMDALPEDELTNIVYLALDGPQVPAIPLMTLGLSGGIDVGAAAAMSVIRMAEPQSWDQSTRMREVLRHSIRLLLDVQGWQASLVALDRFLSPGEDAFRERILARATDEIARSREYCQNELVPALMGEKGTANIQESIRAARRRLETFTNDRRLRRSLAVPPLGPRISLAELLTGGRMVLVPVNESEIGATVAPLVSMLIMQMVKSAFLGRTDKSQRRQAVIIMDEFTKMAESEVADIVDTILREARKFGASQVLATQSVSQLDPVTKKNVQVNTNHKIVLLVSEPDEARDAARVLGSDQITDVDIRNMPKFHGYVRAMADKAPQPPCLLHMLPPMTLASTGRPPPGELSNTPPQVSDLWKRVTEMARGLGNPLDVAAARPLTDFLRALPEGDWEQVVADAQAWNRYLAARLAQHPELEPDKVQRAKKISRALYGLPWWLREAHYWRVRSEGKRPPGRPKQQAAPAAPEEVQAVDYG